MKRFKKYFIPNKDNGYQPYILCSRAISIIAGVIIFFELIFLLQIYVLPHTNFLALLTNVVVDKTNESRLSEDISQLKVNQNLNEAARLKANDMAEKGYFSHISPEGINPWHWFELAGYSFVYAGENLAINFVDAEDVVEAWMDSPKHRANILNNNFTEIGIATIKGMYKGSEAIFVVQMFGRPNMNVVKDIQIEPTPIATPLPLIGKEGFVAVQGIEAEPIINISNQKMSFRASSLERLMFQPKSTVNTVHIALLCFVLCSLILTIFIKIKIQYPKSILNGLLALSMIVVFLLANEYLGILNGSIF